jgi:hypothetical protein
LEPNLNEPAGVEYDHWLGTFAGDQVDVASIGKLMGIDERLWWPIVIEIHINNGYESIEVFAVPAKMGVDELEAMIEETGRVEVTLVKKTTLELSDQNETNPPRVHGGNIETVRDFLEFGFKRVNVRLKIQQFVDRDDCEIVKVNSIVHES